MKKKIIITLCAMFAFVTSTFADTGYVFKGKIGNYPIVFTIWATAVSATGDYYYVSQGPNNTLQLDGDESGSHWIFTETLYGKYNGTFRMKWNRNVRNGYKTMSGTYTNIQGKTYNVRLNCVKVIANPYHC